MLNIVEWQHLSIINTEAQTIWTREAAVYLLSYSNYIFLEPYGKNHTRDLNNIKTNQYKELLYDNLMLTF